MTQRASWHDFNRDSDALDEIDRLRMQEEAARNSLDDARGYISELKDELANTKKILREVWESQCNARIQEWWHSLSPEEQSVEIAKGWHPGACKDFVSDRYQDDEAPHNTT